MNNFYDSLNFAKPHHIWSFNFAKNRDYLEGKNRIYLENGSCSRETHFATFQVHIINHSITCKHA